MDYSEVYAVMEKELQDIIATYQLDSSKVNYTFNEFTDKVNNRIISIHVKCMFDSTEDKMFHVPLIQNISKHYLASGNVSNDKPLEFSISVSLPNGQIPKG